MTVGQVRGRCGYSDPAALGAEAPEKEVTSQHRLNSRGNMERGSPKPGSAAASEPAQFGPCILKSTGKMKALMFPTPNRQRAQQGGYLHSYFCFSHPKSVVSLEIPSLEKNISKNKNKIKQTKKKD